MVPASSHKVSRVSWYSGYRLVFLDFAYGAFTLSGWSFQGHSAILKNQSYGPNPGVHALRFGLFRVRSPLLTESHVVFSSSGYLDVSVPRVPFHTLWIGVWIHEVCSCRFPHSEICGSIGYLLLTAAYRSLSRPSSALSAKASTLRSSSLDHPHH